MAKRHFLNREIFSSPFVNVVRTLGSRADGARHVGVALVDDGLLRAREAHNRVLAPDPQRPFAALPRNTAQLKLRAQGCVLRCCV